VYVHVYKICEVMFDGCKMLFSCLGQKVEDRHCINPPFLPLYNTINECTRKLFFSVCICA